MPIAMTFTEPSSRPTHTSQPESDFDPSQRAGEDHFRRDREEASKPEQATAPDDPCSNSTDPAVSNRKSRSRAADSGRVRRIAQEMMGCMDEAPEPSAPDALPDIECAADCLSQPIVLPPEVVHGVFHRGAKAVIGGGSKSYKTWVLSDLALSVATGREWLGFPTTQGRVLYLNLELARPYFNQRLQQIGEAKEISTCESNDLSLWHLRGYAADLSLLGPKIIKRMEEQDYSLLIIDPIYKAIGRRDENKAGDITDLLNELERLAVKTGAAVVFGAHFSKGNQASKESIDRIGGSGVYARDPDSILVLTKHETDEAYTVDMTLRNHSPVDPFVVRWDFPLMRRDLNLNPARLRKPGQAQKKYFPEQLLDALGTQALLSSEWFKLVKAATGMGESSFHRERTSLVEKGQVLRSDDDKRYRRLGPMPASSEMAE